MLLKYFLFNILCIHAFFNPNIKLSSGKTATIYGNGPPVLFSTGLYGTIPPFLYSNIINKLKKKLTIITINSIQPLTPFDVIDLTDTINVDSVSFLSHSSFNPKILELDKINNALLVDPIIVPSFNFTTIFNNYGFNYLNSNNNNNNIKIDYPMIIIKSEKLYKSKLDLPSWQELNVNGDLENIIYDDVGHPDILDDTWAELAKNTNFWGTATGKTMKFKEWKYNNLNTLPKIRKEYRQFVTETLINLINKYPEMKNIDNKLNINELPIN